MSDLVRPGQIVQKKRRHTDLESSRSIGLRKDRIATEDSKNLTVMSHTEQQDLSRILW